MRIRPSWLAPGIVLLAGSGALLQAAEAAFGAEIGGLSFSSLAWLAAGALCIGCVVAGRGAGPLAMRRDHFPILLFAAWCLVRLVVAPEVDRTCVREVYLLAFPAIVSAYAASCRRSDARRSEGLLLLMMATVAVPIVMYAVFLAMGWVHVTRFGPFGIVGPRPISLYVLLVMAVSLAEWRFGDSRRQRMLGAIALFLGFGTVIFTCSRMAGVVAFGFVVTFLLGIDVTRTWKVLLGGGLSAALAGFLILNVPILQQRFFEGSHRSLAEAFANLNVERRNVIWSELSSHAARAPLVGSGPGSSRRVIGDLFLWPEVFGFYTDRDRTEFYPHNEYLLVWNDYGLVGLALFSLGWLHVARQHWTRWRRAARRSDRVGARWNMAAFLSLGVVLTTAVTDNTLHYLHVVAPMVLLSTHALALAPRPRRSRRRSWRALAALPAGRRLSHAPR